MYIESEDFIHHEKEVKSLYDLFDSCRILLSHQMIILDIGAGQGMHAGFLAQKFSKVYCADIIDYSTLYEGAFIKLLEEKYRRNNLSVPMERICFVETDAANLNFETDFFDLAISINSLEHIADPHRALLEMLRVTKPGGYIYVSIDPIWTADTGSHFFDRVQQPWAHLLLSKEQFVAEMVDNGASNAEVEDFSKGINRFRLTQYENILRDLIENSNAILEYKDRWAGTVKPEHMHHPNYEQLISVGFGRSELLVRGLCFILRKPSDPGHGKEISWQHSRLFRNKIHQVLKELLMKKNMAILELTRSKKKRHL